jgi:putative RecB family exonuclease
MRTAQNHDHLSYSQVNCYMTCGLQYKFKYVDQIEPAHTAAALAFGSGIHEAVAAYYQTILEGDYIRPDQMFDVYRDTWRGAEKVKFFKGDSESSLDEKAKQMLTVFHQSVNPDIQVVGVEEFFELPLGGLPVFQGYIDLIEQSPDGHVVIADLKTSSKKLSDSNAHSSLQLTAYSAGAEAMGFDPENLSLRLDVLLKTKNPEMIQHVSRRTADDRYRFIKLLYSVWNGIQQEVFFPRQDWSCGQCAWAKPCKEW